MENFEGNYSRETKIKLSLEMKAQRLTIGGSRNRGESLSPTKFETENVGLNSPILRYLCGGGGGGGSRSPLSAGNLAPRGSRSPLSAGNLTPRGSRSPLSAGNLAPRASRSPLSAVENLINRSPPASAYRTPVKAVDGEEVLVMDGLPFKRRSRFSGSESSGSSGKSLFKADIFQSSENSDDLRQSPKVQLSRAKEDQRPTRLTIKNLTESQLVNDSSNYDIAGLFNLSPDSLFLPRTLSPTFSELGATPARTASPTEPRTPLRSASPTEPMPPKYSGDYTLRPPCNDSGFFVPPPYQYTTPSFQLSPQMSLQTVLDIATTSKSPQTPTFPNESAPPEQPSFPMDSQEQFPPLSASLKKKRAKTSAPNLEITSAPNSGNNLGPDSGDNLGPESGSSQTTALIAPPQEMIAPPQEMIVPQAPSERWSPRDDGIIDVDDGIIDSILYGSRNGARRLPACSEFCPDY